MRISTKGGYGIRAMYELAAAHGQGPIPLKVVAEKQSLSENYLEQLMGTLRKAGLVRESEPKAAMYWLSRRSCQCGSVGLWKGQ